MGPLDRSCSRWSAAPFKPWRNFWEELDKKVFSVEPSPKILVIDNLPWLS